MGHVCPSGVTPRFSHGLHDCGAAPHATARQTIADRRSHQADPPRPLACCATNPPAANPSRRASLPPAPGGKPRRQCRPAPRPAVSPTHHTGPPHRADDTADKRFACFAIAERHPVAQPGPPPPTPAAKPISSDPQHHPTCPERSHPTALPTQLLAFWADVRHIQPHLSPARALSHSSFFTPPRVLDGFAVFGPRF